MGGRSSTVPINVDHVSEAIESKGGSATSVEILEYIQDNYSDELKAANPNLPEHTVRQIVMQRIQGLLQRKFQRNTRTKKWEKKGGKK